MNNRELFLAFAGFERVSRIPRRASFTSDLYRRLEKETGRKPEELFTMDSGRGGSLKSPADYKSPDFSVYFPDYVGKPGFTIDGNGCGHLGHGYYHFTEYISPLRNAESFEELERYPIPSNKNWSEEHLVKSGQAAHAAGIHASIFVGHMYESAWQIRGYEPFLMDLLTQREWAELLLDRIAANNRHVAEAAARAGYDCIMTGDDVANQNDMMFHPDLWRQVMKPRWASIIGAAKAIKPDIHVWYHSDGNVWSILDDLVEIGVDILNPVQPECMNPLAIRNRFGKRLAFDGCVGTQTTFPFGTPDDVRKTVRKLVFELDGMNGGLMLSPTHVLEPEVPVANILEFFDACGSTDPK